MARICPHCAQVRPADSTAPEWQCPACERAYSKAGGGPVDESYGRYRAMVSPVPVQSAGGRKWLLVLVVAAALGWLGKSVWPGGANGPAVTRSTQQPEVLLYATEWCGYCAATRRFFEAQGIRYTEFDIEKSAAAREGHRKLGGNGVPVILVGETVVHGYNEDELRRQLKPWLKGS